jgi:hypothetical protein
MVGYMHALTVRIDQVDAAAHANNYPHQQAFQQLGQGVYCHRYGVPLTYVNFDIFSFKNCCLLFVSLGVIGLKNVYMFTP